jgi:PE family
MSFVTTQPQMLAAVAGDLEAIGSALSARNAAAADSTTGVVPAGADEVSALTATEFAACAQIDSVIDIPPRLRRDRSAPSRSCR